MKIGFIVGEIERHQMELSYDHTTGDLRIMMDGAQVLQDSATLPAVPVRRYELSIGDCEKHRLALLLAYGEEPVELGKQAIPRLSLTLAALAQ